MADHKSHPQNEEYEGIMAQLGKKQAEFQQMIQERQKKSQDINETVKLSKAKADKEMVHGGEILTALKRSVEKTLDDFYQTVQKKLKSKEKQADDLIKELGQEIEVLTNRSSEVKQLSHTKDPLKVIQTFKSLKDPPKVRDWTKVKFRPPSYEGTLDKEMKKLVVQEPTLKKCLQSTMDEEREEGGPTSKTTLSGQHGRRSKAKSPEQQQRADSPGSSCDSFESDESMEKHADFEDGRPSREESVEHDGVRRLRPSLMKYACDLTLDPNTAHRLLSLSEDNRKVTQVEEDQSYPDHPDRFDSWHQVLGREALTGRCYWEVEWEGGVEIGVTYRGITRRGVGGDSGLGENNKSWSLYCRDDGYSARYNGIETDLPLPSAGSTRVGVYLDRPAGSLSFYRVSPGGGGSSDTLTHLHTFQASFTQEVLLPGVWVGGGASVSLCRL
ncbi:E3 ubiquitin/ISG15 ligase TRIM25-like [Gadus chalcogrammus]|uniref:E3 ubiquitin/ISG15 ligase TRIM25-like n=1 Tax=Gadus chalcogrammus TaxID=1042646 RepID=UPI0024C24227|nr:E3 ubiquitin/ISG15 ligase TRIM25-like [Gadus chalcogrammus]XP_056445581.1 E3 ubiquitin/ISG15 ligase TRIM25-like [Gadus chalcogrammus]